MLSGHRFWKDVWVSVSYFFKKIGGGGRGGSNNDVWNNWCGSENMNFIWHVTNTSINNATLLEPVTHNHSELLNTSHYRQVLSVHLFGALKRLNICEALKFEGTFVNKLLASSTSITCFYMVVSSQTHHKTLNYWYG